MTETVRLSKETFQKINRHVNGGDAVSVTGGGKGRLSESILIRNDTGADQGMFAVLGVSGVVIDPASALAQFHGNIILTGQTASLTNHGGGKLAILAEPIPAGKIGRAYLDGVCTAAINVIDQAHTFAELADGTTTLESVANGPLTILWAEAGTGPRWAVVRFGGGGGLGGTTRRAQATEGAGSTNHITCKLYNSTGGLEASTIEVYFSITGGTAMSLAIPKILSGVDISVTLQPVSAGVYRWHCDTNLQALNTQQIIVDSAANTLKTTLDAC